MKKTETELLLQEYNLTINDLYRIAGEAVTRRVTLMPRVLEYTTINDIVQDVLVYYLSIMKSVGEIRINYYIKKYHDRLHLVNLVRQTAEQFVSIVLTTKEAKHIVKSLQMPISVDSNMIEMQDIIVDEQAEINLEKQLLVDNFLSEMAVHLNKLNYMRTQNYISANNKTQIQIKIMQDLLDGYSKKELKNKYESFSSDIKLIKYAIANLKIIPISKKLEAKIWS